MGRFLCFLSSSKELVDSILKTDPFKYFNDNGVTDDAQVRGMAAAVFQIAQPLGLALIAIATLWAIIKWGMTPPAKKKEGIISVISWKFFLFVIIVAYASSPSSCQKSFRRVGMGFKMLRQRQITAQYFLPF